MKNYFTKKNLVVALATLSTTLLQAQGQIDLQGPANQIKAQVLGIAPIIFGIGFLIACFANIKHFYGENADMKKGILNILIFAILIGVIYGIVRWVFSQTI